jgi:hypothetical protein
MLFGASGFIVNVSRLGQQDKVCEHWNPLATDNGDRTTSVARTVTDPCMVASSQEEQRAAVESRCREAEEKIDGLQKVGRQQVAFAYQSVA